MAELREAFQAQASAIREHAPAVQPDADPEELHKLRVAIRRMRALLRAARPLIDDERAEPLRSKLGDVGRALGPARDADVLAAYVEQATADLDEGTAPARLLARVAAERREAYAAARGLLDARSFDRLMREVDTFSATVVIRDAPLNGLVNTESKKLRKAMRDIETDEGLHRARVQAKRLRYAAEVVGDEKVVARAKEFQDVVGEHQDAVVAEERLRALAKPSTALLVGRLIERQESRRADARRTVPKAWKRLEKTTG
ncbi:MAG TPA: CHAD domain-containing protein [Gaiellaceae bacterium]|nr:CHAD domain-containing protein [Gaiellaceae bacterium]